MKIFNFVLAFSLIVMSSTTASALEPKSVPMFLSDFDGLTMKEEISIGTNPFDIDTDNDGYCDGDEEIEGTNPLGGSTPTWMGRPYYCYNTGVGF